MWSFNLQNLNDSGMISVFGWLHSHLLVKGYTTGYILFYTCAYERANYRLGAMNCIHYCATPGAWVKSQCD